MQVWATVVHGSAGLHDVVSDGCVTVVVPPEDDDTVIAWWMPAPMEPDAVAVECDGTAPPTEGVDDNTIGDGWNTAGPVVAPGAGAAAAAAKAAAGMDETSPSSTTPPFSVGPCVKNSDGGTDC